MPFSLFFILFVSWLADHLFADKMSHYSNIKIPIKIQKVIVIDSLGGKHKYGLFSCWSWNDSLTKCGDPTSRGLAFSWKPSADSLADYIRNRKYGIIDTITGIPTPYLCEPSESERNDSKIFTQLLFLCWVSAAMYIVFVGVVDYLVYLKKRRINNNLTKE